MIALARFAPTILSLAVAAACAGGEPEGRPNAASDTTRETTTDAAPQPIPEGSRELVARVIDGDTIELEDGRRVRLLQIDAPEPDEDECYSRKATQVLRGMLPQGTPVRLVSDPALDERDRYDRLLRYVFDGRRHVNLLLVRRGAASVWFFEGERGMHADRLLRAARNAKAAGQGLWGACPGTELDPGRAIATAP
jgi:endonuclease YncB( thermonuclease family)